MERSVAFRERVEKIESLVNKLEIEGIIFLNLTNIRYLTGFSGSEGAFFAGKKISALFVDGRYTTQAKEEAPQVEVVSFTDKMADIAEYISGKGMNRIGFESSAITYDDYIVLRDRLFSSTLIPLSRELKDIRAVKDKEEIAFLKKAADKATKALARTFEVVKPGVSEKYIAAFLESSMLREGSEKPSFETIVASGANAALPHAHPGERIFKRGDLVVIDYGAVYRGYHSDETVTIAVEDISDEEKKIYNIVKEAHDRALDEVKADASCRDIDDIARSFIHDAGYGHYFSHGTGHGVGLDVHEEPAVSAKSQAVLKEGMVVTIEPGIYIPGVLGVRIESMVLVNARGCDILTGTPKDLIILK
ncbi:MAG: Xaa-Pro peptidase family protein [Syntrophales bacterium]|jgi:Xaa-Pro aminopeptidase/Xaa-Pro dipeptidase|nr:Xaa-Pro peptidase family protein [Syntrophales bacterium]MDY0044598.1 Xaa-Pro peptidase family protein [Syntrophales bacterium]